MTGGDVRGMREALGWTGTEFGQLLGVHASTVFRWESADHEITTMQPLQSQLLVALRKALESNPPPYARREFQGAMLDALAMGGTLRALHALLTTAYGSWSPRKQPPDVVVVLPVSEERSRPEGDNPGDPLSEG